MKQDLYILISQENMRWSYLVLLWIWCKY